GRRVVAKLNAADARPLFDEEAHGLRALASAATILVPELLTVIIHESHAVLLMTALAPAAHSPGPAIWRRLGTDLAALHQSAAGERYGFDIDNHIGSTPQPNSWHDDWVEFNAVNRLGFQIALARDNDQIDADECRELERLVTRL